MPSPRAFANSLRYHARRTQVRALALPRGIPWLRRALHLPVNAAFDPLSGDPPPSVRIVRLDAAETFQRPLPQVSPEDPAAVGFFTSHALERNAPSYVAELDGGVAWGHPTGGVFTAEGHFAPAFTHDPWGGDFHTAWRRWRLPAPRPLPGRTLYLVTPEATDNFHHWLIDLLPRIGLVQRAGYDLATFDRVIVNHAGRRYQRETLQRLGIAPDRIVVAEPKLWVRAEQLVVPSLKPTNQSLPAADVAFLRRTFLESPAPAARRRRLFLSRADAGYRRLENESAMHGLLRELGFEIVTPGALTLPEQARIFSEAELVAGPAGAAFANLVFATAPARVIEIVPPQWIAAFHWMISARLGLEHTILLGDGPVMRGVPGAAARRCDVRLDPERLVAAATCRSAAAST